MFDISFPTNLYLIFIACALILYTYLSWNFSYWKKRGVKYVQPTLLVGNMFDVFAFKKSITDFFTDMYKENEGRDHFGIWVFRRPALIVRNLDAIKAILLKDFNSFNDRTIHGDSENDPIGSNNLFILKNPDWKWMRTKLTPVFTSGKIKAMLGLLNKVGSDLVKYVDNHIKTNEIIEVKEMCAKFTTDSIATIAFGVEAYSFEDPEAVFRNIGRKIFEFTWARAVEVVTVVFAPEVAKFFKFKVFSSKCSDTLRSLFWKVMTEREIKTVERNDLLNILIQLKKDSAEEKGQIKFEGDTLVAQAVVFFAAGYETTSNTMAFVLYELAKHPQIQERLRNEMNSVLEKYERKITYEAIQDMSYLDMCIKESLRKYPPLAYLDRTCKEKYTVPGKHPVTIDPGVFVYIPVLGLQMDPKYFPNPECYDPERFSPENVKKIQPFTYMPFGNGPRNCIGERFGLLQTKIGLINIIKNFHVSKCKNTPEKIILDKKSFLVTPLNGIELHFKARN